MFIPLHPKAQDIDFAVLDRSGWCLPLPGSQYGRACTDFVVGSAPLTETMPSNHLSLQPFFDLPDLCLLLGCGGSGELGLCAGDNWWSGGGGELPFKLCLPQNLATGYINQSI